MTANALGPLESHLVEWVHQVIEENHPLNQVAEEKIQEIHTTAFLLYRDRHYQDASHFFRLLAVARPSQAKYWKGLGACLQMQKNYEEALNCYLSAQILNGEKQDPYLYVHAADCYFALQQRDEGLKALESARLRAERIKDQKVLKHVALMRDRWSK